MTIQVPTNSFPLAAALDDVYGTADFAGVKRTARALLSSVSTQVLADILPTVTLSLDTFQLALDALSAQLAAVAATQASDLKRITQLIDGRSTNNVNIASGLTNGTVINGVTLVTGRYFFLPYQSAQAENGLYLIPAAGAASRATFADSAAELAHITFTLSGGTLGTGEVWTLPLNTADITVGTTALVFALVDPGNLIAGEVITARGGYASLNARLNAEYAALYDQKLKRFQRIGTQVTPVTGASTLPIGKWFFEEPAVRAKTIREWGLYIKNAGEVRIKVATRSGDNFTDIATFSQVFAGTGYQILTPNNFGTINVPKDAVVGIWVAAANIVPIPAGTVGYYGATGADTSPISDNTYAAADIPVYFLCEDLVEIQAQIDTDTAAASVNTARSTLAVEALSDVQYIGAANPVTGASAGAGHFTLGQIVQEDAYIEEVLLPTITAGPAEFFIETIDAAGNHTVVQRSGRIMLSAGVNTYPLKFPNPARKGQLLSVRAPQAGWGTTVAVANTGYYNTTIGGALSGTYNDATLNTATEIQIRFKARAVRRQKMLSKIGALFTQEQIIGVEGAFAGTHSASAGTYTIAVPVRDDGVAKKISFESAVNGASVRVFRTRRTGTTNAWVKDLGTIITAIGTANDLYLEEDTQQGDLITFQSATIGFIKYKAATPSGTDYFNTPATSGDSYSDSTTAPGIQLQVRVELEYAGSGAQENRITIATMDTIGIFGDSYYMYYAPVGMGAINKVSQNTDWCFFNLAKGGNTVADQLARIRNNDEEFGTGIGPLDRTYSYVIMNEGWNSGHGSFPVSMPDYEQDETQYIETARALGAIPVIGTEWRTVYSDAAHVMHFSLAEQWGALLLNYVAHEQTFNSGAMDQDLYASSPTSSDILTAVNHPGARTNEMISNVMEDFVRRLPRPANNYKIFRRRSVFTVGTIDDLAYRDNFERGVRWEEIRLNQFALNDPSYIDTIYNPSLGLYSSVPVQDEYSLMQAGNTVNFPDYALLSIVVDATAKNCEGLDYSNVPAGVSVYVMDALAGGAYPADGVSVDKMTAVTVSGGVARIERADIPGKMHYDRFSLVLYKAGGFDMPEPEITWYGQPGKNLNPVPLPDGRATGASILTTKTIVDASATGWTVEGGAAVTDTVATTQFPYGITRILKLEPGKKYRQTLNYAVDNYKDRKAEVTLWLRWMPVKTVALATYPGSQPFNHLVHPYRRVIVEMLDPSGNIIGTRKLRVGPWWSDKPELTFRTLLPLRVNACDIRIYCETDELEFAFSDVNLV